MEPASGSNKRLLAIVGLIIIVAVVGVGVAATSGKKSATTAVATPTPHVVADASTAPSSSTSVESASTSSYKDGTYAATGTYDSPGGQEAIKISVTLKDGTITDTSATSAAIDSDGQEYQSMFIGSYKSLVVGKSIDSVHLSKVSGSSLTGQGFNSAIDQIKSQAQA